MHAMQPLDRFAIPNVLRFEEGSGGLVRAVISTAQADADLYLQGAHLAHWTPCGQQPVLFVSPKSLFLPDKAIRGGVPIIFPWFGPRGEGKPGPAHGFARTGTWQVETTEQREDGAVAMTLTLLPNDVTGELFPAFHLRFCVTVGTELEMELETRNDGDKPFTYEGALHTYFSVGDVLQVSISGLESTTYIDKTDGSKRKQLSNEPIRFAKETDQVHVNTKANCVINDPMWNRRIIIEKSGSDSTVVWNPWIEKTMGMSDMAAESWEQMVCVETANAADNAITLAPKASHKLTVRISVKPFNAAVTGNHRQ